MLDIESLGKYLCDATKTNTQSCFLLPRPLLEATRGCSQPPTATRVLFWAAQSLFGHCPAISTCCPMCLPTTRATCSLHRAAQTCCWADLDCSTVTLTHLGGSVLVDGWVAQPTVYSPTRQLSSMLAVLQQILETALSSRPPSAATTVHSTAYTVCVLS
jgi:hypothetical protein